MISIQELQVRIKKYILRLKIDVNENLMISNGKTQGEISS